MNTNKTEAHISQEVLEVLKAIQTISTYRSKHTAAPQTGFENVTTLVDALIETATKEHPCTNCGHVLKLYVRVQ